MNLKLLLVTLSSGVMSGLCCFYLFDAFDVFKMMGGNVMINVGHFVTFIAALTLFAAFLALMLRAGLERTEGRRIRELEDRIASLELERPAAPPARNVG